MQAIMTMQNDLTTTAKAVQSTAVRLLAEYDHGRVGCHTELGDQPSREESRRKKTTTEIT